MIMCKDDLNDQSSFYTEHMWNRHFSNNHSYNFQTSQLSQLLVRKESPTFMGKMEAHQAGSPARKY
jgi:hypothetical protein